MYDLIKIWFKMKMLEQARVSERQINTWRSATCNKVQNSNICHTVGLLPLKALILFHEERCNKIPLLS